MFCSTTTLKSNPGDYRSAMNMTKGNVNNNKNQNRSEATTTQFFSAITSDQCPEKIVHIVLF
jgi:hypothetical protein